MQVFYLSILTIRFIQAKSEKTFIYMATQVNNIDLHQFGVTGISGKQIPAKRILDITGDLKKSSKYWKHVLLVYVLESRGPLVQIHMLNKRYPSIGTVVSYHINQLDNLEEGTFINTKFISIANEFGLHEKELKNILRKHIPAA
jgi:hypothetical protein